MRQGLTIIGHSPGDLFDDASGWRMARLLGLQTFGEMGNFVTLINLQTLTAERVIPQTALTIFCGKVAARNCRFVAASHYMEWSPWRLSSAAVIPHPGTGNLWWHVPGNRVRIREFGLAVATEAGLVEDSEPKPIAVLPEFDHNKVRELRERLSPSPTQAEAAACLGVSTRTYASIENGSKIVTVPELIALTQLLQCGMEDLIF